MYPKAVAAHRCRQGPVDTLKSVKTGGAGLYRPAPQNHPPVKRHIHPRRTRRCHRQCGAQVLQSVCERMLHRELRPRKHHWHRNSLQHEGEHRGRIGHGISPMSNHYTVIFQAVIIDVPGNDAPLLRLNVGGVQVQDVLHRDRIVAGYPGGHQRGQRLPVQPGGKALLSRP